MVVGKVYGKMLSNAIRAGTKGNVTSLSSVRGAKSAMKGSGLSNYDRAAIDQYLGGMSAGRAAEEAALKAKIASATTPGGMAQQKAAVRQGVGEALSGRGPQPTIIHPNAPPVSMPTAQKAFPSVRAEADFFGMTNPHRSMLDTAGRKSYARNQAKQIQRARRGNYTGPEPEIL